jgi:hypothetical protein
MHTLGPESVGFLLLGALTALILREIFCWYWKINKVVSLLEDIEKNTRKPETSRVKEEDTRPRTFGN